MHAKRINGFDMGYAIYRPDQAPVGPPLVLIHGFPLDGRIWADVAAITSRTCLTIVPDLRGFGGSAGAAGGFTIDSLAEDVHALLEEREALPAVVAGLSMGGYVALSLARAHSSDLAGLALVDTRAGAEDEAGKRKRMESIALLQREGPPALADQMLPNLLADVSVGRDPDLRRRVRDMMLSVPAETMEQSLLAMRDRSDQAEMLAALKVPLAVVVGAEDKVTPVTAAQEMAGSRPASLTIIPSAGHLTPVEQPAAVAEALLTLQRSAAGRAGGSVQSGGRGA